MPSHDAADFRYIFKEAGRCRGAATEAGMGDRDTLHAARDADISQPAFFIAVAVDRWHDTVLESHEEHMREFEAFRAVQCH